MISRQLRANCIQRFLAQPSAKLCSLLREASQPTKLSWQVFSLLEGPFCQSGKLALVTFCSSVLLTVSPVAADNLKDQYARFENQSAEIDRQTTSYEDKRQGLERQLLSAEENFKQCAARSPVRVLYERNISEADAERAELEKGNSGLQEERRSLEDERISLDAQRRQLSASDPSYSTELQNYIEEYNIKYNEQVKDDLFLGYDKYFAGIEDYDALINAFADECRDPRDHKAAIIAQNFTDLVAAVASLKDVVKIFAAFRDNSPALERYAAN